MHTVYCPFTMCIWFSANRLSSTMDGNREMGQLYTTSLVSNITRKKKISHISWHVFKDSVNTENKEQIQLHVFYCKISTIF